MIVDRILLNLTRIHDVDTDRLGREGPGKVRSCDYQDAGGGRRTLEMLPVGFPRMRGRITASGRLIAERLRFRDHTLLDCGPRKARMSIARPPELPATLIAGLGGTMLSNIADHPSFEGPIVVETARMGERREGGITFHTLELDLHLPLEQLPAYAPVHETRAIAPDAPDALTFVEGWLERVEKREADAMLSVLDPTDPRGWADALGTARPIIGMRTEQRRGVGHLVIRFGYDKTIARDVGRGGFGAWFDRSTWSWCTAAPDFDGMAMVAALERHQPIVMMDQLGLMYQ